MTKNRFSIIFQVCGEYIFEFARIEMPIKALRDIKWHAHNMDFYIFLTQTNYCKNNDFSANILFFIVCESIHIKYVYFVRNQSRS